MDAVAPPVALAAEDSGATGSRKRQRIRERNRLHARKSREKKKERLQAIERGVEFFRAENARLTRRLNSHRTGTSQPQDGAAAAGALHALSPKSPMVAGFNAFSGFDAAVLSGASPVAASTAAGGGAGGMRAYAALRSLHDAAAHVLISDANAASDPVTFASPRLLDVVGYRRLEVYGQNALAFLRGPAIDDGGAFAATGAARLEAAVARRVAASAVIRGHAKGGAGFWAAVSVTPVGPPGGAPTTLVWVVQILTDDVAQWFLEAEAAAAAVAVGGGAAAGAAPPLQQLAAAAQQPPAPVAQSRNNMTI